MIITDATVLPAYTSVEAARYLGVPVSKLRSWSRERRRRRLRSTMADAEHVDHGYLSFADLVEAATRWPGDIVVTRDTRGGSSRLMLVEPDTSGSHIPAIVIDPQINFGRPMLDGACISTSVIAERIEAGERFSSVARDYRVSSRAVLTAVLFERRLESVRR